MFLDKSLLNKLNNIFQRIEYLTEKYKMPDVVDQAFILNNYQAVQNTNCCDYTHTPADSLFISVVRSIDSSFS